MTGPEHYEEAERLIESAEGLDWREPSQQPEIAQIIAAAQVHAALALAAATTQGATLEAPGGGSRRWAPWRAAGAF